MSVTDSFWHPNNVPDDDDAAAYKAVHWAGLLNQAMDDPAGFGFVAAAVEYFGARVTKEDRAVGGVRSVIHLPRRGAAMTARSRRKGADGERSVVHELQAGGLAAEKVSAMYKSGADISLPLLRRLPPGRSEGVADHPAIERCDHNRQGSGEAQMTPVKLPRPCQCGEWVGLLAPSRQVVRTNCNVIRTTLSERVCSFIAATAKQFGEPKEPVICRKRSSAA